MKKKGSHTDEELIVAIRAGGSRCDSAMEYLYREHLGKISAFVVARNGSREEAKDVFQDAIVNLLLSIQRGKFEGKSSLHTFLYAISKNLWYRRFNRNIREEDFKSEQPTEDRLDETPEVQLVESDQQQQLMQVLNGLKAKCKEVLSMWAQKFSMKEIADHLGYGNDQVVRNKKNACLKELKEKVRAHPEVRNLIRELVR